MDSSAILAIYLAEPDAERYALAIESDAAPIISAASVLECSIVMRGRKARSDSETESWLDGFLQAAGIAVHDVSARQIDIARMAHRLYGKGSGHGASLNFGDCFAYALAKAMDVPLLYKGDDFTKTDIRSAV